MAATFKDIMFLLRSERYKRDRSGTLAPVPLKRSAIDLRLVQECPPDASLSETIGHCIRPIKKVDR
jgi:hypothetical protein